MREITFTLSDPFPLLNHSIGQSRFVLTNMRRKMARSVAMASASLRPPEPFSKAHVVIERYSMGSPDNDGLQGGAKFLIDSLTTPRLLNVRTEGARQRTKNKRGLGFIIDDAPQYAKIDVIGIRCKRDEQRTVVTIREVLG